MNSPMRISEAQVSTCRRWSAFHWRKRLSFLARCTLMISVEKNTTSVVMMSTATWDLSGSVATDALTAVARNRKTEGLRMLVMNPCEKKLNGCGYLRWISASSTSFLSCLLVLCSMAIHITMNAQPPMTPIHRFAVCEKLKVPTPAYTAPA